MEGIQQLSILLPNAIRDLEIISRAVAAERKIIWDGDSSSDEELVQLNSNILNGLTSNTSEREYKKKIQFFLILFIVYFKADNKQIINLFT